MSDYYNLLGVDRNASPDDIKRAYRKLAAQHHPDRGGDTAKFQEIQQAYDTLSDPEKRSQYDNPQPQGFPGGFHFHSGGGFPPGFEDIFNNFPEAFGGMFRRAPARNKNLNIQTSITLEDSFFGKELIANINLPSGRNQTIEIKIPRGIQDGTTLRLSGMGDDSMPNMPRGDIHLTVKVQPSAEFQRQGDDLIKTLDINCLDAIVGKNLRIHTIDKKELEIKIHAGAQHGQIFSIHGYGMPNIQNNVMRGRLLVQINIIVPTNLSETHKDLIKQIIS